MNLVTYTSVGAKPTILISNGNILEVERFWMSQFCTERTPCRIRATPSELNAIEQFLVTSGQYFVNTLYLDMIHEPFRINGQREFMNCFIYTLRLSIEVFVKKI